MGREKKGPSEVDQQPEQFEPNEAYEPAEPEGYDLLTEASTPERSVNEQAELIRRLEIKRDQGFSRGRMILTLSHKYGYSEEEAASAIAYLKSQGLTDKIETADLKSGFGQMPPFIASEREELMAALKVMARPTQVSKIAETGKKKIEMEMHHLGYTSTTTQNKAFYTTDFYPEKGDVDHSFHMLGWHGTGRYVGGEKTILEFYDDQHSKTKPVVSIGVINEDNVNPAKQLEVVQHILDYLKTHG